MAKLILEIILMALAVWRISCIITNEEFVFGLAQKLRLKLGVIGESQIEASPMERHTIEWYQDLESYSQPTVLARGITCMYCVTFWLGLAVSGAYMAVYGVSLMSLCLPFVLSALAIGFDEVIS